MTSRSIKKAVFPLAGLGTRFLPATKASPKEMLPIVDKPLIQYAVEEAIDAGISELIFITSSNKRTIEDHFDFNFELETKLLEDNNIDLLEKVNRIIPSHVTCIYIRQMQPLGLGHAILQAKSVIGKEPFAVLLADDLVDASYYSCLQQMISVYDETTKNIIAVESIDISESSKYGIIKIAENWLPLGKIEDIVEKPLPSLAPSKFAVVGRYILDSAIFNSLEQLPVVKGVEMQLTNALALLLKQMPVFALKFIGKRYDCGNKLGYLQANIAYALRHPEVAHDFKKYLLDLTNNFSIEEIY